jgi:uncharacterized protein (TIGR02266 family)
MEGRNVGSEQEPRVDRSVRVAFPIQVSFAGESLRIKEFTGNLSVGGLFLPTERSIPVGTRGTLTFRMSHWDDPFTVHAEVAWIADQPTDEQPVGIGMKFVDLEENHRKRLWRLMEGIQDGSVVESIRRSIREEGKNLHQVLRQRPTDQKVIFATCAQHEEISALIRDGNPSAVLRLLENPRLTKEKLKMILRDQRMPTKVLLAMKKVQRLMAEEEIRVLFCLHLRAPLQDVLNLLPGLSGKSLNALATNATLRQQIRTRAKQLAGTKTQALT